MARPVAVWIHFDLSNTSGKKHLTEKRTPEQMRLVGVTFAKSITDNDP
jgi:hypothetical protein